MEREEYISQYKGNGGSFDFIVIGGGATGLGIAIDSASRGLSTLLLEQSDFAKGTSGRSTKLVHGGVRYLREGDIMMVLEASRERGYLRDNAPHLVHDQRFIIPLYRCWEKPFYGTGLFLYNLMAGRKRLGNSSFMSMPEVLTLLPGITREKLRGGVSYHDCRFDDSRMAVSLMQTARDKGAIVLNHVRVTGLIKNASGRIAGVTAEDCLDGGSFSFAGRCVINATGVFVDTVIRMDNPDAKTLVQPSQGVHLVVDRSFLGGDDALMIPRTSDGRVMFCIPWYNRLIIGTTDVPSAEISLEPGAMEEEVQLILQTAAKYLERKPVKQDVLTVYAGLRPLAAPLHRDRELKTREISRRHALFVSGSGLLTITGGKWTTYRLMAEETVTRAMKENGLPRERCITRNLRLHGYMEHPDPCNRLQLCYGSDFIHVIRLHKENPSLARALHDDFDFTAGEVVWAVRREMARSVDDVLARRLRALYMNAKSSVEMAPAVASIMAGELGKDDIWERGEVEKYSAIAKRYMLAGS
jgi:glycerol-3-phosphate dehydrogenase